ncbi:DUF4097 family beta strand repeat-containing protein [Dokdonella soli]|uniref:DUF2807 domain-containing protein n=1 Tax=Dokdonella soli TaxID=529810 RepID=A0ABN1ILQ5_9GAMM
MRSLLFLIGLVPALAAANECKFTAQRDFDVDAAGLKTVAFALGSSDVVVEGAPDLAKVEVRARACASDQAWLADLTVDQQRSGDRVTITPHEGRDTNWSWFHSSYAYIELHVRVPAKLAIDIKSSSGDADVRNVAALAFDAGSGDLRVDRIAGTLTTHAGSGDVTGAGIGSLDVRGTGSGDITLRDVHGDVKVAHVGSGDLHFANVGGSVDIGSVGSGDVSVDHAERDVTVDSIGSGDLSVSNIGGNFTVRSRGSGDVNHRDVRGSVSVPRDND